MNVHKLLLYFSVVFFVFGCWEAKASLGGADAKARQEYNQTVERIYNGFVQLKDQYPELKDFSRNAMGQDRNGFDTLSYEHDLQGLYGYRFSLHAEDLTRDRASDQEGVGQLKFPLLGFEVAIESKRSGGLAIFDPRKIIEENFQALKVLEQDQLPVRLELKTDKDVYRVREQITLTVSLKNMGSRAFKVADLNEESLYCAIDDKEWGTQESTGEIGSILKPYGSLYKILKVEGINVPKEAWIVCTYGLGFKGVQPYSRVKVLVQPNR